MKIILHVNREKSGNSLNLTDEVVKKTLSMRYHGINNDQDEETINNLDFDKKDYNILEHVVFDAEIS